MPYMEYLGVIHHYFSYLAAGFMGFFWALARLEVKLEAVSKLRTPNLL